MARPARVRIRSRKPWVLARRRLFGWKVRLLTVSLHHIKSGVGDRARPWTPADSVVSASSRNVGTGEPLHRQHVRARARHATAHESLNGTDRTPPGQTGAGRRDRATARQVGPTAPAITADHAVTRIATRRARHAGELVRCRRPGLWVPAGPLLGCPLELNRCGRAPATPPHDDGPAAQRVPPHTVDKPVDYSWASGQSLWPTSARPRRQGRVRGARSSEGVDTVVADELADLADVWNRAISQLDDPSVRPHQRAWLSLTRPIGLLEDTALLAAPNTYAKDYLENNLRPLITAALSRGAGPRDQRRGHGPADGAERAIRALDAARRRPCDRARRHDDSACQRLRPMLVGRTESRTRRRRDRRLRPVRPSRSAEPTADRQ